MQEMLSDVITIFFNFKVLIVKNFKLEFFYLTAKVIFHDDALSELSKIIQKEQRVILNGVDISSVDMVDQNLVDGGLKNIRRMYQ